MRVAGFGQFFQKDMVFLPAGTEKLFDKFKKLGFSSGIELDKT